MALDQKTISAINKEKEKFKKKKKDGKDCEPMMDCGNRELDDVRIAVAANGFVIHPSYPADEFLAKSLDEAFEIARQFLAPVAEKKKNNLQKKK